MDLDVMRSVYIYKYDYAGGAAPWISRIYSGGATLQILGSLQPLSPHRTLGTFPEVLIFSGLFLMGSLFNENDMKFPCLAFPSLAFPPVCPLACADSSKCRSQGHDCEGND